jgi:hypothetical protein
LADIAESAGAAGLQRERAASRPRPPGASSAGSARLRGDRFGQLELGVLVFAVEVNGSRLPAAEALAAR